MEQLQRCVRRVASAGRHTQSQRGRHQPAWRSAQKRRHSRPVSLPYRFSLRPPWACSFKTVAGLAAPFCRAKQGGGRVETMRVPLLRPESGSAGWWARQTGERSAPRRAAPCRTL